MMKTLHDRKIQGYKSIGYEVIADNGHCAMLAYVPYSQQYVKLAEIVNGRAKSSIALSLNELKNLNNCFGLQTQTRKKNRK